MRHHLGGHCSVQGTEASVLGAGWAANPGSSDGRVSLSVFIQLEEAISHGTQVQQMARKLGDLEVSWLDLCCNAT